MPLVDNTHYVDSVGYAATATWAVATAKVAGNLVRATAPATNSERIFICIVAGTTHATTQPTWVVTRGAKTTDNTVTWQECTGLSAVNGDLTNTPNWTTIKNTAIVLGQIIKRDNLASYQICTTAGTAGNGAEPAFSDTAGATTVDGTVTWTSIGVVGNFTGGLAPHARLANALATNWGAAGNTIYVKSSHAATQGAAIGLAGAGSISSPQRWLCHNGGAYPPAAANLTTGASETATSGNLTISSVGVYVEGISFTTTANATNNIFGANGAHQRYRNCSFVRTGTTGANNFGNTNTGNMPVMEFDNCTMGYGNTGSVTSFAQGTFYWRGGSMVGGVTPTTWIGTGASPTHASVFVDGMDLSAFITGTTLVGNVTGQSGLIRLTNCKLGAGVTLASIPTVATYRVEFINCSSGAFNYDTSVYDYYGTLTTDTGVTLNGGASDGTTPFAWKITTVSVAKFDHPFVCPPIVEWNNTTGASKTLTIQGIWGSGSPPNDDEIWVEVQYLGSASSPVASFVSDAKATVLTTAAAQDAGSGTWTGSTTKFALSVSFTPQMKGPVTARVKVGAPSATFYIDPRITLT